MKENSKWKRYLFILLILATTYSFSWINIPIYYQVIADDKIEEILERSPEETEIKLEERKIKAITEKASSLVYKKWKNNEKYLLKKEIQNKKKYHKTLLEVYNNNFSQENLKLVIENWMKIKQLKEKYLLLVPKSTI